MIQVCVCARACKVYKKVYKTQNTQGGKWFIYIAYKDSILPPWPVSLNVDEDNNQAGYEVHVLLTILIFKSLVEASFTYYFEGIFYRTHLFDAPDDSD
jgi:hypothetical protein